MGATEDIQAFQQTIKRLEQEHAHFAGQKAALLTQLKEEFGINDAAQGDAHAAALAAEIAQLEQQVETRVARLRTLLG